VMLPKLPIIPIGDNGLLEVHCTLIALYSTLGSTSTLESD
jgi:hypothetical protein